MEKSSIITLNVGGTRFQTTRSTLLSREDTFFTRLLSERMGSLKDETGAFFIDRDPSLFAPILNFLRMGRLVLSNNVALKDVLFEADFYGISAGEERKEERVEFTSFSERDRKFGHHFVGHTNTQVNELVKQGWNIDKWDSSTNGWISWKLSRKVEVGSGSDEMQQYGPNKQ
jgi:hypothetical protein